MSDLCHSIEFDDGYSERTKKTYASDWRCFTAWCRRRESIPLPASPETLVAFVEAHEEQHHPATIAKRVSTVAAIHKLRGLQDPTKDRQVTVAIKRLYRRKGRRQRQATAIGFQRRCEMIAALGDSLKAVRDKALISTAYDVGCRRSELVAIRVEDIARSEDCSGTVLLRKTKSDQAGDGHVRYLAADTMARIDEWQDRGYIENGLLFRALDRHGTVKPFLRDYEVPRIFKMAAAAAQHDPVAVRGTSGHSTRVGMAQDMASAGIDLASIMQAGGWKTPSMVARYIENMMARNGAAAKLASAQGRTSEGQST